MFYYFVKSERSPREDPLIVWLTGGPGCSSFMGFAFENGFLFQWFADHPEFLSNSLYIGGDSYSGITVPVLTQEISNGIQGYLLGNPVTDRDFDDQAKIPYCHGMGLIPDEFYESGDHDMIVPHISTQSWIKSLGFSIVDDWRPWSVDGQVAGFTRMYSNNLTFATIKGGGHTAPEYRPKECSAMFRRWISENPL
ncbi:Serine carboxypeptidase-like 2 [Acorus gramineus]|uniref:Serine carboxypeptidase-like 2 n=1 Tax=Acorus gramineus TaxID=55184 RepID=A0AAV9AZS1_ACOGR|nr:Serine carboxypeptidase-like 2 [Acorus gramineus]